FILDLYASGEYFNLNKPESEKLQTHVKPIVENKIMGIHTKKVCEHILISKLKERDFFGCDVCQATFFNYKQILVHIMSNEHVAKASF
ncbi:hypothetical protein PFISCL1PPCAC_23357, partial [Pristionchus fissidentatus]